MRFENAPGLQMPLAKRLEPGKYFWCQCGKSANPPFCDGTHEGSGVLPLEFTVDTASTKVICSCGLTENPPNCDGRHKDY